MNIQDCLYFGYIKKTHGIFGDLRVSFNEKYKEVFRDLSSLFIDIDGALVPFIISKIHFTYSNEAIIKLQDIKSIERASKLIRKKMYLLKDELPKLEENHFYEHEIIGFKVIDTNYGEIGYVNDVFDNGPQSLLQILKDDTEILVPMADEIIIEIDKKLKQILLQTPEGLIDLYLY